MEIRRFLENNVFDDKKTKNSFAIVAQSHRERELMMCASTERDDRQQ